MTTQTNAGILAPLIHDHGAALAAAEKTYWSILTDSTRTTPADQAAMAEAMKLLNITHAQAMADIAAIKKSNELAAAAADHISARKDWEAAQAAFSHWWKVERPAAIAKLEQIERDMRTAIYPPKTRVDNALLKLKELREHRAAHPRTARFHAAEPEGSPEEIRSTTGTLIGPEAARTQGRLT